MAEEGKTRTHTCANPDNVDFIIVGNGIVGYKVGGEAEIPHNGIVLSLPKAELIPGEFEAEVRYEFANGERFAEGIQCGPGLVWEGEIALNHMTLKEEQFFRKRRHADGQWDAGVVPTDYAEDVDRTRAARVALGVDIRGACALAVRQ